MGRMSSSALELLAGSGAPGWFWSAGLVLELRAGVCLPVKRSLTPQLLTGPHVIASAALRRPGPAQLRRFSAVQTGVT